MADLAAGTDVAGYRIDALAGRGGMGVVYRATDLRLGRVVALKVIAPALAQDPVFRARFERESRLAASIRHPNVVTVFYAGEHLGLLYVAMEYVDGTDLRAAIASGGRLDTRRALAIVSQVASALDAAHARGLVHRDVKPANVLLSNDRSGEQAYLSDFGLTKQASSDSGFTATGAFVGTIDYVAPEQIAGAAIDARADVYSLGCVLYHALTGQVPFARSNDLAKIYAHANDPPPPLGASVAYLPEALEQVVAKAMAKRPEDRYPSAGAFAHAARSSMDDEAVTRRLVEAASEGLAARDTKRRRSGLVAAVALVAVAVIAVAALAIAGVFDGGATPPPKKPKAASSSSKKPTEATGNGGQGQPQVLGQVVLTPQNGANAQGIAYLVRVGSKPYLVVQAKLPPLTTSQRHFAYEVWLYNSRSDAKSVGAQYTDEQGNYQGRQVLPADFEKNYKYVEITKEPFDNDAGNSGDSLVRGAFADLQPVPQQDQGGVMP
jgi:serine/threonine-protein kinase